MWEVPQVKIIEYQPFDRNNPTDYLDGLEVVKNIKGDQNWLIHPIISNW